MEKIKIDYQKEWKKNLNRDEVLKLLELGVQFEYKAGKLNKLIVPNTKEIFKKVENIVEISNPNKCPSCGYPRMLPNGTCHICPNCGSTSGCS